MGVKEKEVFFKEKYNRCILNKEETAFELGGISESTIDRLRKTGELKSKKIGGQVFFDIEQVAKYVTTL